tara:strand:- start:1710 stop:3281 length:1572 start_codon:yes stop_codon:yes gene_type:complete
MAINNYGGFADGFKDGFGLVNDVIDRKNKQNNVEDAAKTQKTQFGLTLDQQKAEAKATAAFQAEKLGFMQDEKTRATQRGLIQDEIAQISAGTARIKAKTAAEIEADRTDPDSNAYQLEVAQLAASKEKNKEDIRVNKVNVKNQHNQDSAVRINNLLTNIYDSKGIYSDALYDETMEAIKLNEGSDFSVNYLGSNEAKEDVAVLDAFIQGMSAGGEVEANPEVLSAFDNVLNLKQGVNLGQVIDQEFVNAPLAMRAGGEFGDYKIVSQGLFSLGNMTPAPVNGAVQPAAIGGTLYVLTENSKGEKVPYFPPLTSGRSMANGAPLTIKLDDAFAAVAGKAYMVQQVTDALTPVVERANIKGNYGASDGSNGVTAWNKAVNDRLATNIKGLQGGSTNIFVGSDRGLTNEQQLQPAELDKMRERIAKQMVYGKRKMPEQKFVEEWLAAEESALKGFRVKGTKGRAEKTLGEIIPPNAWNPQLISALSTQIGDGEPDADGAATSKLVDPAEFLKQMKLLNLKSAMEF